MAQYLPIFAMMVLAALFAVISRVVQKLLVPPRPNPAQTAPYECGITPEREPSRRFPVTFFLVAMIFIVFDIEIIFFFPFAMAYKDLGAFGLGAIILFSAAVFESFVYLIGAGALNWGPAKQGRRSEVVSPDRTATSTIRRVGADGRATEQGAAA